MTASGDFLDGGGETGAIIRGIDWSGTPLGPMDAWPQSLRTIVSLMLANGHAMCLTWGPELTFLYNDAYAPILAARHPAAMGKAIDIVWSDVWPDIEPLLRRALAGETVRLDNHHLVMTRKGYPEDTWWSFSYSPLRDESGTIRGMIDVCVDFTEMVLTRRKLEAERMANEAALRDINATLEQRIEERSAALRLHEDIIQSDDTAICAFDTDFRLIAFNKAHNDEFYRVNGFYTKIGDVFCDLFVPEQRPIMRAQMARALTGESFTIEEAFGNPAIHAPRWEIHYSPLRDADGKVTGAFHHARDISARLRAQAELAIAQDELRQAQKMDAMGQLTGGVAHDFNNLLTPIVGVLDLLKRKKLGGEREQRLIEGAASSAERARVLVQRLLAFARRQPLQASAVDVVQLVEGMRDLISSTVGPRVQIETFVADDLPPAMADPNQLEMALLNLAVNARDAMPEGGTLRIEASLGSNDDAPMELKPGSYVRLAVQDNGVGMSEDVLARAVEPFFSTKGVGKGTGLGLSMVHGLASQLGGALHLESHPHVGSKITLWLPTSSDIPVVASEPANLELPEQRGLVLLVDDEDVVRVSTADMLSELGYQVVEAVSAEAALALLDKDVAPNLVVTDHLMPGMTGSELARVIRQKNQSLPVLIISGYAESEGIAPDLPRLTKPFRRVDLVGSLAALMS